MKKLAVFLILGFLGLGVYAQESTTMGATWTRCSDDMKSGLILGFFWGSRFSCDIISYKVEGDPPAKAATALVDEKTNVMASKYDAIKSLIDGYYSIPENNKYDLTSAMIWAFNCLDKTEQKATP